MAHPGSVRARVRAGYVRNRLPLSEAARQAGVSPGTARTWKRQARLGGDDWDTARNAARLAEGGLGHVTERVLDDFSKLFESTIAALKTHPADPLEVTRAMATLSNAYAQTVRAAGCVDPKLARLGIAADVLKKFGKFLQLRNPELAPAMLGALEAFGAELAAEWS